jgi:hypothetical protein
VPVSCNTTALTGNDGLITFKPAGVQFCLQDATDFPAGKLITVPGNHDFHVGDPVVFTTEGAATLDPKLTASTKYYVVDVYKTSISVSATKGGTAITLDGLGGNPGSGIGSLAAATAGAGYAPGTYTNVRLVQGTATTARATVVVPPGGAINAGAITITTPGTGYTTTAGSITLTGGTNASGAAIDAVAPTGTAFSGTATLTTARENTTGHINIKYSDFDLVCMVQEWSMDFSRESIDITTLPCKVGGDADKYASFRTTIPGYASGTGSMSVLFSGNSSSLSGRLIANSLLKSQAGATVKLYVNAIEGASSGVMDDTLSSYIEAPVSLEGFSISVNTSDAIVATINFSLSGPPSHLFNLSLS